MRYRYTYVIVASSKGEKPVGELSLHSTGHRTDADYHPRCSWLVVDYTLRKASQWRRIGVGDALCYAGAPRLQHNCILGFWTPHHWCRDPHVSNEIKGPRRGPCRRSGTRRRLCRNPHPCLTGRWSFHKRFSISVRVDDQRRPV